MRGPQPAGSLALTLVALIATAAVAAVVEEPPPTFEESVAGLERRSGLLVVYLDDERGRLLVELPPAAGPRGEIGRWLWVEGLTGGLGSNPVGLDRGQLGPARLILFRRVGGKILIEQPNLDYRALDGSAAERVAVRESFASSVLWSGEVEATGPDGRLLVDLTSFLLSDAHDVAGTLDRTEQGAFELDLERSAVDLSSCLVFPDNVEIDVLLTWAGGEPGGQVRRVTPTPRAVTLIQHHSLVRLPGPGYEPREFDPRMGSFAIRFQDYAAALDETVERRWIVRHRLQKTDPDRERSTVERPLVYYVDSGTPEPVRSALIDGASWWAEAFEAAGFIDAFRVELLPEDVHPLDVRFNVIQWVHRSTRGWSYGGGVIDPRTGEMLKAHVNLGSLRVRQDRLLFEGLTGADGAGSGGPNDPLQLALARIRQLSAHEVGHTLGLSHNFAGSTYADRASVMDYPAPWVRLDDRGRLDLSRAYGVGVGAWDLHAMHWAYAQFAPGVDRQAELARIVEEGLRSGHVFLSDEDARPAGAAHPRASLWDNGDDAAAELDRWLDVRRHALDRFGEGNVAAGTPVARLEEVLGILYFSHRYQLSAAAKAIGGLDYRHALRGDGQTPIRMIGAEDQRRALRTILRAIDPAELDLSESVIRWLPPRPPEHGADREQFGGRTAPMFDALGAAATAADLVIAELLQPERAARMIDLERRDPDQPGFDELLDTVIGRLFDGDADSARLQAIREESRRIFVSRLIALASNQGAAASVRAVAERRLAGLGLRLEGYLGGEIRRYLERGRVDAGSSLAADPPTPGSPIGSIEVRGLAGCSH